VEAAGGEGAAAVHKGRAARRIGRTSRSPSATCTVVHNTVITSPTRPGTSYPGRRRGASAQKARARARRSRRSWRPRPGQHRQGARASGRIEVRVTGPGAGRESSIRALQAIRARSQGDKDVTPIPHKGCRRRNAARLRGGERSGEDHVVRSAGSAVAKGLKLFLKGRAATRRSAPSSGATSPGAARQAAGQAAGLRVQLREKQKVRDCYGLLENRSGSDSRRPAARRDHRGAAAHQTGAPAPTTSSTVLGFASSRRTRNAGCPLRRPPHVDGQVDDLRCLVRATRRIRDGRTTLSSRALQVDEQQLPCDPLLRLAAWKSEPETDFSRSRTVSSPSASRAAARRSPAA